MSFRLTMMRITIVFVLLGVYSCNAFLIGADPRKINVTGICTGIADGKVVLMGNVYQLGKPPKGRMIEQLEDEEDNEEEYNKYDEEEYDEDDDEEYNEDNDTDDLLRMGSDEDHAIFVCGSGDISAVYVTGKPLCKTSSGLRMMDKKKCNGTADYTLKFKALVAAVPSSVKECLEVKCVTGSEDPVMIPALCPSDAEYGPCSAMKPKASKKPKKGSKKPKKGKKKPKKSKGTKKPKGTKKSKETKKPKGLF